MTEPTNWQDSPWHKAAALFGVASNEAHPLPDRLTAAIQALDLLFEHLEQLANQDKPTFSDIDVAVENGVIKLYGDGDKLIADLSREKAETLWYMLRDGIVEHGRQIQMITSKGCEAS